MRFQTSRFQDSSRLIFGLAICLGFLVSSLSAENRVYEGGKQPNDARLKPLKDLNDYFPFEVPPSVDAWKSRAAEVRRQVLVATGLWPQPELTPLNPVIHSKMQRKGFTVEKVYFEGIPNHFVTGLLFRPDDGKKNVKRPAVLCPHGHGGRLQDHGEKKIRQLIADGEERFLASGRFPKLARCAQLARMGCVVFIFDMVGYADSTQISYELAHRFAKQRPSKEGKDRWGLFSAQAEMRLQSIMGVQTWNSVRCLDFLEQLPDVDKNRIAVTGGSGGGTQTILLCGIDSRPVAAFPNGMVSTSMQGGCTCENCSLLRIGTGNVELTALFAPKPQAMTAADDWTKEMLTKGYPQLQSLYSMFGAKQNVYCRNLLHFPHNYNSVTRATMYAWFNKHLKLGFEGPILEEDFQPLSAKELTVWDTEHPKPKGGDAYEFELTNYLAKESDQQIQRLQPHDAASLDAYRAVVGEAFEALVGRTLASVGEVVRTNVDKQKREGYLYFEDILRLESKGEELPMVSVYPTEKEWNGSVAIWIDGQGKRGMFTPNGKLDSTVQALVEKGVSVLGVDLFQQGEFLLSGQPVTQQRVVKNPREAPSYSFCYNHTLFARRVHDVLTVIAFVKNDDHGTKEIQLIGTAGAGPIAAAARALSGSAVSKAVIDTAGFRFANITSYRDANFLPGVVKYGDLPALLALHAPHSLRLIGEENIPDTVRSSYQASGGANDVAQLKDLDSAIEWLVD